MRAVTATVAEKRHNEILILYRYIFVVYYFKIADFCYRLKKIFSVNME